MPVAEFRESLVYKEYLSQIDVRWICGGIVFDGGPGLPHTSTSYFRGHDQPPYDAQDRAWAPLLIPHLSRALGLMHRLKATELNASSLRASRDGVRFGMALLNAKMQVVHLNDAARPGLLGGVRGAARCAGAQRWDAARC